MTIELYHWKDIKVSKGRKWHYWKDIKLSRNNKFCYWKNIVKDKMRISLLLLNY